MARPRRFPDDAVLREALAEYRRATTYWYAQKARALNDKNVAACAAILKVISNEFPGGSWNQETQDALLTKLIEEGVHKPRVRGNTLQDRLALIRIAKKLLETLGLLWVQEDQELGITDAGLALLLADDDADERRRIIEAQVAKIQYPNPLDKEMSSAAFRGIIPHLFLLQVLQRMDYQITFEEFELFLNLATEQGDVDRLTRYITRWRTATDNERDAARGFFTRVPARRRLDAPVPPLLSPRDAESKGTRFNRIKLSGSYQRAFFGYPSYLAIDHAGREIRCVSPEVVDALVREQAGDLKVATFESPEAWFAYFGDPEQRPSWFTYVALAVETAASEEEASTEIAQHVERLSREEAATVRRLQVEKAIESSYAEHPDLLHTLEAGLTCEGRQVETPIGRMDLLCRGNDGKYVVVEIKAREAEDAVFGQVLRYMGWIHRNYADGADNVRGIILASHFPERARYSRIGLMRPDAETHLKFRRHAFAGEEV